MKVTNSFADGISVQNGKNVTVSNSTVIGSRGNGLHPGTGLTRSQFINNHCEANGAGLYFCWHNTHLELRENRFVRNRGGGVTGLGFPGDRNNLLENNLIEDNGGPGIAIDGGGQNAGNVIRGNIIRDNSVAEPGKYGAIHMLARPEDVRGYVIEGNTIESTTDTPTQYIGIREQNGSHNGNEHFVDGNTIRNNQFAGHRVADVVTAGEATTVEGDSKVITDEAYQQQNEQ